MSEELQQEIERYKETNRRLNRRCQKLEKRVSKYRRRYVAVFNPAKEWHNRAEWEVRQIREIKKELWKMKSFGYFHWSYFKSTIRNINSVISIFAQRTYCYIKNGHFHDLKYWNDMKRLAELEAKEKK